MFLFGVGIMGTAGYIDIDVIYSYFAMITNWM